MGAGIFASVKTKDSIVAISGAIMPEPLAIPTRVTSDLPIFTLRMDAFGNVSVVMIAAAASAHFALPSLRMTKGNLLAI